MSAVLKLPADELAAALDWKNPDYGPIYAERALRLERIRSGQTDLEALKAFYRDHPGRFISDWAMTYDPRNPEIGLPATIPFVLFAKQAEFIGWLHDHWRGRRDGLCEKSRDMGVTWLCVWFAVWMWLFHPGTVVGFGSRKEEYVDKIGDPKSIFWKIRQAVDLLPVEFRPALWNSDKHAPYMRAINPENGATIVGEAGDNIGRGNRTSVYFKDEAQPLTARIVTPDGMATMADMQIGAKVIGQDGRAHTVIGINDAGMADVYRVGFSDGTFAECSPNHQWTVEKVIGKRERLTLRTTDLVESFRYTSPGGQVQYRYRVPVCRPVEFAGVDVLPLDPYLLGALLGDGSVANSQSSVTFTSADDEVVNEVARALPSGYVIHKASGDYGFRIVSQTGRGQGRRRSNHVVLTALREMGVHGCVSHNKRVPERYLLAGVAERLALLQGLMDTDGSASGGVASFHTCSMKLAEDVRFLVQSLGGTATHNVKRDRRGHRNMQVLHMTLPDGMVPFRLARKALALKQRKHPPGRTIVSIERRAPEMVRCISLDSEDGLYLTDACIVTHNSAFYEHADAIEAALSQTSNVKIDVSTPNGAGNAFYRKRHGGKVDVFVFDWRDDPRKDKEWYRKQLETLDQVIVAQEIDRDYEGSVTDAYIDGERVRAAMARGPADVQAVGPLRVGVDPARFGDDKFVITFRRGRVCLKQVELPKLDSIQGAARTKVEIETFGETPEQIAVEVNGLSGAGTADTLRQWFGDIVVDVNTSLRMSDQKHYNLRAFMYAELKEWLLTASIPNDPQLKSDLTAMRYGFRGGELLLEDKKEMKARGIKSPDRGDSLALTFAIPVKQKKKPPKATPFVALDPSMGY